MPTYGRPDILIENLARIAYGQVRSLAEVVVFWSAHTDEPSDSPERLAQ